MIYEDLSNVLSTDYAINDITAVYAVRATEYNPWVIERVGLIKEYYSLLPHILIVDFGSSEEYAQQIQEICKQCGFEYKHIPDEGVFSQAIARNIGFSFVKIRSYSRSLMP